ncbi:MAG: HDOD domain-containing protein [Methylococcaceae bacterium]
MTTNADKRSELDAFINQANDLFSQQEQYLTNTIAINVEQLVSEISDLMSLPEIYLKIRELMDDPDSCLDDFAVVVNTDIGLVSAVLKLVNSAFFGFAGQIDNVKRALNLIGIGQLHDLVLSISAVDCLDLSNDIESLNIFWQRSIFCGVISKLLAGKLALPDAESLFVIGLLHEIGRLILFLKYPEESRLTVHLAKCENRALTEVEKSTFGTDYGEIGQALMAEWGLPVKFQCIIGHQLQPSKATDYLLETSVVHIAHTVAVNKFPGADSFEDMMDPKILAQLNISEEDINNLCTEANIISGEMERLIFG